MGSGVGGAAFIALRRHREGLLWTVLGGNTDQTTWQGITTLEKFERRSGLTFVAHSLTTAIPWSVAAGTAPKAILGALDKQRKRRLRGQLTTKARTATIAKIKAARSAAQWNEFGQHQAISHVWDTSGRLTNFQQWTVYRLTAQQLNLFHAARERSSDCTLGAGCGRQKETIAHIMWGCNRAWRTWRLLLSRWSLTHIAEHDENERLGAALQNIASRSAPAAAPRFVEAMQAYYGFLTEAHSAIMQQIWHVLTTVGMTTLWLTRNETVHKGERMTPQVATRAWTAGVRQVRAISGNLTLRRETRTVGIALWQCAYVLEETDLNVSSRQWSTARLHFDGGARETPDPAVAGGCCLAARLNRHRGNPTALATDTTDRSRRTTTVNTKLYAKEWHWRDERRQLQRRTYRCTATAT